MLIPRPRYVSQLRSAIDNPSIKCIVLDGPRQAGKTTLLKHIYDDDSVEMKKYYYSFDDQLSTKQFKDSQEFISFMQIKFGIDFSKQNILFLNEIQYSKNIGTIIHDLINEHQINTKIVATWITQGEYKDFLKLDAADFTVITIHTLSLVEFLEYKWIHTKHLDPLKLSSILFSEIEPLLKEFITRWAYPSVVVAKTADEKKEALKHLMQSIIMKDVSFWFRREEIAYFEQILAIINDQHSRIHNKRAIKNTYEFPAKLIDKYTQFLEDHFLITTLSHFYTDKTREVSHKKNSYLLDMGIKNYLNNTFSPLLHDPFIMRDIALQEIYKSIPADHHIAAYQKINGSKIDYVVCSDKHIIPVVVGDKNTESIPKVFAGFSEHYGEKIETLIKTTASFSSMNYLGEKPVYVIPYFLIGKYLAENAK